MRRLAWTLGLATALVPRQPTQQHTRRTVQQKANIFEQAADAASKFFEERARQDSLALAKFTEGLEKSRQNFLSDLRGIFDVKGASLDQTLEKLEDALLSADIGATTTDQILDDVKAVAQAQGDYTEQDVTAILRGRMAEALMKGGPSSLTSAAAGPTVILVLGANGMGKTTTIGKLASMYKEQGKEVLLAAGDTFRAAAVMQLEVWGRRTGCDVVKGKDRADPGSVIFDAVKKGVEIGADVVICDTAGRLHTKTPLMEELKKVGRTAEKALGRPADEVLLVLDATTGQNAIQQAELFKDALEVSGIALTKLDGTAKGGVILGIVDQHRVPVRYVGIGERVEDLREFQPGSFVEALFARPDEEEAAAS